MDSELSPKRKNGYDGYFSLVVKKEKGAWLGSMYSRVI